MGFSAERARTQPGNRTNYHKTNANYVIPMFFGGHLKLCCSSLGSALHSLIEIFGNARRIKNAKLSRMISMRKRQMFGSFNDRNELIVVFAFQSLRARTRQSNDFSPLTAVIVSNVQYFLDFFLYFCWVENEKSKRDRCPPNECMRIYFLIMWVAPATYYLVYLERTAKWLRLAPNLQSVEHIVPMHNVESNELTAARNFRANWQHKHFFVAQRHSVSATARMNKSHCMLLYLNYYLNIAHIKFILTHFRGADGTGRTYIATYFPNAVHIRRWMQKRMRFVLRHAKRVCQGVQMKRNAQTKPIAWAHINLRIKINANFFRRRAERNVGVAVAVFTAAAVVVVVGSLSIYHILSRY